MMRSLWSVAALFAFVAAALGCNSAADQAETLKEATATAVGSPSSQAATVAGASPTPAATPKPAATATATQPPAALKVVDSGFVSYKDSSGTIVVPWAVVLTNTSSTQQAINTKVTALFYGADNVLLKTDDDYAPVIFPGQTMAAGSSYLSLPSVPARMDIRVAETKFQTGKTNATLTVSESAYRADRFSPKVAGKVTSPFDQDLKSLQVACIVTASDVYVAVGFSFLDLLPAATTAIVECSIDSRLPVAAGSTVRLFVAPSSLTGLGP